MPTKYFRESWFCNLLTLVEFFLFYFKRVFDESQKYNYFSLVLFIRPIRIEKKQIIERTLKVQQGKKLNLQHFEKYSHNQKNKIL
jgi:hypothetical protein